MLGSYRFLAEKPFPLFLVTLLLGVFDKLFHTEHLSAEHFRLF